MSNLPFERLHGVNLQSASRRQFLNVRRLIDKYRPKSTAADQALKIIALIGSQSDVSSWEDESRRAFIDLSCDVFSADLSSSASNGSLDPAIVAGTRAKADWLCSISAFDSGSGPIDLVVIASIRRSRPDAVPNAAVIQRLEEHGRW